MIVFDLKCAGGHVFEAWFRSSADFESQKARSLLCCPMCGQADVAKAPMAANVPAKGNSSTVTAPVMAAADEPAPEKVKAFLSMMAKAQSEALKESTWVGRALTSHL